jgi:hypothetical protein
MAQPVKPERIFPQKRSYLTSGLTFLPNTPLWTTNSTWIMLNCALFLIHEVYPLHAELSIYRVSKHHKHHSTYPSMCHSYEPGHFATFSPMFNFNTNFTHKDASHKESSLISGSPVCMFTLTFLCIIQIIKFKFNVLTVHIRRSRIY